MEAQDQAIDPVEGKLNSMPSKKGVYGLIIGGISFIGLLVTIAVALN